MPQVGKLVNLDQFFLFFRTNSPGGGGGGENLFENIK